MKRFQGFNKIFFSLNSCSRNFEKEASLPCFTAFETENESFNANLCCDHWIESNEGVDFIETSDHDRAWLPDLSIGEEDWTWNANVDDANDARCTGASNGIWTTNNTCDT